MSLALAAGLVLLLGQGVRRLIDVGFASADGATHLNQAAGAMFAVVTALGLSTSLRFYLMAWLGERVAADMRAALFAQVLRLSPAYFETMRTGDVLTRLTTDTAQLQGLIGAAVSQWLRSAVVAAGALVMLVVTSAKLALLIVAVIPLVVLPMVVFGRRERKLSRSAQDRIADLGAYAEETTNALRTVQAFTHEAVDRARFGARVENSIGAALRRARMRAALILSVVVLGFGAITLSLWAGGLEVVHGRMSGGELSAFVFYAVLVATSATAMSELWGEVQRAAGSAGRIAELLAEPPGIAAPARPAPLPMPPVGRVEFDAVSFRYPSRPDASALDGFTLCVEPGETVALVGPSGAGKTTVFQMLLRFYDPSAGRVLLDGVDVRAAARAASAGFLDDLPQGFDTFLGERGIRLSGGQRQRVAIARALLRDAPVLLLDEATSALDAESEAAVQHALAVLAQGRTTVVIAHRLATVRRADRIVVMDAGRVVATGPHEALVRQGGLYARLAELQFAAA